MKDKDMDDIGVVSEALDSYLQGNRDIPTNILMRIIAPLDEREREIMRIRMGLGDESDVRTYSGIGERLNISPGRVMQIEARAYSKFRHGWAHAIELYERSYRFEPFANLANADFRDAQLIAASLEGANLTEADLQRANLTGANLSGANLEGALLVFANLTDADLRGANLTGANLTGAHLERVNLTGANLTGAILTGANLTGATMPDGSIHD
jgi:hypothetical protein